MAFRSALKLIYRPVGLIGDPQQAYRHLVWNLTADGLTVRNPGPYYVTLFSTRVNGSPIDAAGVVAPFSTRRTEWCRQTTRCAVRWQKPQRCRGRNAAGHGNGATMMAIFTLPLWASPELDNENSIMRKLSCKSAAWLALGGIISFSTLAAKTDPAIGDIGPTAEGVYRQPSG